jgi:hypothetical protein
VCYDTDWINLADDREHWRDLVNTVMKLRTSQRRNIFLTR